MCELLAPAGDMEALKAALLYGADAVYMGGPQLQLRAKRAAFDENTLREAICLVHAAGKKAYIAVNCYAYNDEVSRVGDYAKFLYDAGADACIVADIGLLCAIKEAVPELEVHVSTQANCQNYRSARAYHDLGAARVVLAREMSMDQIAELRAKTPKDLMIETFVHGAMCMSYSGRCIISSFLAGRSGNRGECAQPCRWNYVLQEEKRPGEYFPIQEDELGTQILSSHDLCMIEYLDQLKAAGVDSFKIEGRMKTAYYVATVVNAYRRCMDKTADLDFCKAELSCAKHRPYSTGFYFGELKHGHSNDAIDVFDCMFSAKVLGWEDGILTVQQRSPFAVGDTLETIARTGKTGYLHIESLQNEDGEYQDRAPHPMQVLRIPYDIPMVEGEFLRKRVAK